jgi:hypothetical protein
MQQNYQDAMSVVRKFGKPDLFVTFTCNPHWNEIIESLLFGQIFRREDKLDLMEHIDDIISAEKPDPNDPKMQKLFNIVSKQMIHGPCGHYNLK